MTEQDRTNPMTDIGIRTYSSVLVKDSSFVSEFIQKKKFREQYLITTYPPGVHAVKDIHSGIKSFDTFSNANIVFRKDTQHLLVNKRIVRKKCYYDPIVTLVDTNDKYYTYNYGNVIDNGVKIKLIVVQISHIPFDKKLLQNEEIQYNYFSLDLTNYGFDEFYDKKGPKNKFSTQNVWQIRSKKTQSAYHVDVQYTDGNKKSKQTLSFFSSVFYLPAYLQSDKNFYISVSPIIFNYTEISITDDARLPLFKIYNYPMPKHAPVYFFEFDYIFEIKKTQREEIVNDKEGKTARVTPNKQFTEDGEKTRNIVKNDFDKENEIDAEKSRNSEPFVRINDRRYLKGINNERFSEGAYNFEMSKNIGSMVIYRGYEVELTYKKFTYETRYRYENESDDETGETKQVKVTYREKVNTELVNKTYTQSKDQKYINVHHKNILEVTRLVLRPQSFVHVTPVSSHSYSFLEENHSTPELLNDTPISLPNDIDYDDVMNDEYVDYNKTTTNDNSTSSVYKYTFYVLVTILLVLMIVVFMKYK